MNVSSNIKELKKYEELKKIFKRYEEKGIPHRGISDEMKRIISTIAVHLPRGDEKTNKILIDNFSIYKFIKKISIDGRNCNIEYIDEGQIKNIKFCSIFYKEEYENMKYKHSELINKEYSEKKIRNLLGQYRLNGECHPATLEYLTSKKEDNINAVTSLVISTKNMVYFHSYIWDKEKNRIIDLSRNIIMDKNTYDFLFLFQEINSLTYQQYEEYIKTVGYPNKEIIHPLLFLSLITLSNTNLEELDEKLVSSNYMFI